MYGGRIVERGDASVVLRRPRHPYTNGLLSSTVHGVAPGSKIDAIPGMPPDLAAMPPGCAFSPRCKHATADCMAAPPQLSLVTQSHEIACTIKPELKAI
ncbi:oligopeptide/dipeptide ABC transporter ATP-binding protein [Falsihalocynthiibacter arcticus]|uniref:oligopeptide/dipeptide ABC transporter ATP-binding protein n=1 Tax=Falsihalocynthiibacter arcticus TaxID=1579316 RepID=UPI002FF86B12